jgi:hypothetical protein
LKVPSNAAQSSRDSDSHVPSGRQHAPEQSASPHDDPSPRNEAPDPEHASGAISVHAPLPAQHAPTHWNATSAQVVPSPWNTPPWNEQPLAPVSEQLPTNVQHAPEHVRPSHDVPPPWNVPSCEAHWIESVITHAPDPVQQAPVGKTCPYDSTGAAHAAAATMIRAQTERFAMMVLLSRNPVARWGPADLFLLAGRLHSAGDCYGRPPPSPRTTRTCLMTGKTERFFYGRLGPG